MEVDGTHTETDSASVIEMLTGAKDVIIVPGKTLLDFICRINSHGTLRSSNHGSRQHKILEQQGMQLC